jgi:hypothetical protein
MELFPPGQALMAIIPKATDGAGWKIKINSSVNNGAIISCEIIPMRTAFGCWAMILKLSNLISNAMLNIKSAKHTLSAYKLFALKCMWMESTTLFI